MKKIKIYVTIVFLLLPLLAPILIQPVKASSNNIWEADWLDYQYNVDPDGVHHPIANLSTTTTLTDDTGMFTTKVALVVPVYDYGPYEILDHVTFRTVLYFDSFAEGGSVPVYTPQVIFIIEKDTDESDLNKQFIEWHKPSAYKGWSQGEGLQQNSPTSSTEAERSFWAFKALAFGVGLFSEPVSVATGLIGVAQSFLLGGPVNDLKDAGYEDIEATSYWGSGVGNFSSPTRQYCFNVVDWYQNATKPSSFYGIKIWAQVSLSHPYHNPYDVNVIWLGPIYLRIHRSHALSISVSSGGTTDPAPGTYTYHYGASVTVTAIADSHYYFDHWILDGKTLSPHPPNTYNPILLLMDSDHNLKACFNWMNHAPNTPSLTGPNSGYVGWSYTYKACATDPDGDSVKYTFYWGDGNTTTGYYGSGVEVSRSHSWSSTGTYSVKVKATDVYGAYKSSSSLTVAIHSVPGGCPMLFVWSGAEYACEGLLDIHNSEGVDVIYEHTLVTTPQRVKGAYLLRLTEHPQTHSYIDEVKLYAMLENGATIELPLIWAWHSEDGNVLPQLLHSDEWKTDTLGADHNNGTSQSIDLKFAARSPNLEIAGFMFQIEGNNPWWKT